MANESRIDRLTELRKLLAVCPTNIHAQCDLASLLEELGQYEKALFNWKAVVASDPNNLKAWEGMTRCRNRTGRPPQSHI
jgi:cytochrome c-type biogenesis protein CcmH/NrfG